MSSVPVVATLPDVSATVNAPSTSIPPSRLARPEASSVPTDVLPVACAMVADPTVRVVPSKVKLESSSSSPLVPAITIRLSVKSLTFALARVAAVPTSILATNASPATPRPPSTIRAPVVLLVEAVVSSILTAPAKVAALLVLSAPARPKPPSIITAPVVCDVEAVVSLKLAAPETFNASSIVVVPPLLSIVRLPLDVSISLSPVTAI